MPLEVQGCGLLFRASLLVGGDLPFVLPVTVLNLVFFARLFPGAFIDLWDFDDNCDLAFAISFFLDLLLFGDLRRGGSVCSPDLSQEDRPDSLFDDGQDLLDSDDDSMKALVTVV